MSPQPTRRRTQALTVTLAKRMLTILCAVLLVFSTPLQSLAQDSAATGEVVAATSDSTEDATESSDSGDADNSGSENDADGTEESSSDANGTEDTSDDTGAANATQDTSTNANAEDDAGTSTAATLSSVSLLSTANGSYQTGEGLYWYWSLSGGALTIYGTGITKPNNGSDGSAWPWYQYRDEITTVEIYGYAGSDLSYMFDGLEKLIRVYSLLDFNLTEGPDMSYMFRNCTSLTTIDGADRWSSIAAVTNIEGMFYNCSSLTDSSALLVGYVRPSNSTTNMSYLFYGCSSLTDAVVSSLGALESWSSCTSGVTNMSHMFQGCTGLTNPNFSGWTTSSVTNMSYMFADCTGLVTPTFTGLNTSSVRNMSYMFQNCTGLTSPILSNLTTSAATNMQGMFYGCSSLTNTAVSASQMSQWNVSRVQNMSYMFYGCSALTLAGGQLYFYLVSWDVSAVTTMSYMFANCTGLEETTFATVWQATSLQDASYMFSGCTGLTSPYLGILVTSSTTNLEGMFYGCTNLTNPIFYNSSTAKWDTSNVTNMSKMFYGCTNLTGTGFSDWTTSKVQNMSYMFYECTSLTGTGFSSWSTASVTDTSYMFYNCSSLTSPSFSSWTTPNLTNASYMFYGCSKLPTSDFSSWVPTLTNTAFMFYGCSSIESLDISGFNTASATNMGSMFDGCSSLRSITLGQNFSFTGTATSETSQALLPTPDSSVSRTQSWILVDSSGNLTSSSQAYTPAGLRDNYNGATMAGIYIWDTTMTVRILANEGSISDTSANYVDLVIFYDRAQTVATTDYTFTRGGYTLLGWSWDLDATTAEYEAGKDIELSANDWKAYYFDTTDEYATYDRNSNKVILRLYCVWSRDTYTLVIYKYADTDTPLAGAKFTVEEVAGSTIFGTIATDEPTDDSGEITLSGLEQDAIYKITETKAPSGYTILSDPIYIAVEYDPDEDKLLGYLVDSSGNKLTSQTGQDYVQLSTVAGATNTFKISIENTKLESLPLSGFTGGTFSIFAGGIALMALAAYVLYRQRKGVYACVSHAVAPYQVRASRPQRTRRRTH